MAKSDQRNIPRFIGPANYFADATKILDFDVAKIGIDSLTGSITQKPWSHKGAWAKILMCWFRELGINNVRVLTEEDKWHNYDLIILEHGMEFDGTFNVYGGASDELAARIEQFANYTGEILSYEIPMPMVGDFVKGRSSSCTERFAKLIPQIDALNARCQAIKFFDAVDPTNHLLIGDSHSLSVWKPGMEIRRHDGKTLYSVLNTGLDSFIVNPTIYEKITVYFGNIDLRHHLCRQPNPAQAAEELALRYATQLRQLASLGIHVEAIAMLPVEDESRKLPKTGYYKGEPFHGSWADRNGLRVLFNTKLKQLSSDDFGKHFYSVFSWPNCLLDDEKLSFEVMERPKSVHLSPTWYRTHLNDGKIRVYPEVRPVIEMPKMPEVDDEGESEPEGTMTPKEPKIRPVKTTAIGLTRYYHDFINYYKKALELQRRNIGVKPFEQSVDDPLMDSVSIYDTVNRRYAGFSKVLEDLHYGPAITYREPRSKAYTFTNPQWHYLHLVHRITGSGASFEKDHGYRNTLVFDLAEAVEKGGIEAGKDVVLRWDQNSKAMFTSIGNQIPPFNRPTPPYSRGGVQYLCEYAPKIAENYSAWLDEAAAAGKKVGIRDAVDHVLDFQSSLGLKRYAFVLTAWVMDTAEYFPQFVDPSSHCYYGKNCIEAFELLADIDGKKEVGYDLIMDQLCKDVEDVCKKFHEDRAALGHPAPLFTAGMAHARPYDVEDGMCDYIRYVENYVPDNKLGSYRHLDLKTVFNNSAIQDHPKGRQKWMLDSAETLSTAT